MADALRLQVLGPAGGYPYSGYASAGYLLKTTGANILLDCGPGVAMRLLASLKATDLDAIIVTHLHPDHVIDVVAIGYALMSEWIAQKRAERVVLWVQPGGIEFLDRLIGLFGHRQWRLAQGDHGPGYDRIRVATEEGEDWFFSVFDVREYSPGDQWTVGDVEISTLPVPHTAPCVAIRAENAGKVIVYTGDTRWSDALCDFAAGCDLLIADAHFSGSHPPGNGHMTPSEAGRLAEKAQADRLMLCHLAAAGDGPSALLAASKAFAGKLDLAIQVDELCL
jgi:ribonuclease BN (tRNA processing enzyme)